MTKKETKKNFEHSLNKLEAIVNALEQGDVSLEESIKLYEEGVQLSQECLATLSKAEMKIQQLSKNLNGKFQLTDFKE